MKPEPPRDDPWMAYHLGELPESERARVEAELKASPEQAESYRRFTAALGAWATEKVPERPFDFQAFRTKQESGRAVDVLAVPSPALRKKSFLPGRLAWGLAAAAFFLFALSRTHFTLTLGNTTIRWGAAERSDDEDALRSQLKKTEEQLALLQGGMEQNTGILQTIAQRQIDTEKHFTEVTDQLSYYQQVEAATRYRDTNALMNELAAYRPKGSP